MHLHGPMQGAVRVCGKGKVIKACYGDVPADVDTSVVEDGVEGLRHYVIDANNCVEVGVIVNKPACFLVDIIGNSEMSLGTTSFGSYGRPFCSSAVRYASKRS